MQETKTREEVFSESQFEWVKTERSGDICQFSHFENDNGTEYVNFTDGSRIKTEFIGDIVLMHRSQGEILGRELIPPPVSFEEIVTAGLPVEQTNSFSIPLQRNDKTEQDPVIAILEKTKKRSEKITLVLNVKIPSPEIYNVIRENFENVDDILLQNIVDQIQESSLRDAVKKEMQKFYSPKKKKTNG